LFLRTILLLTLAVLSAFSFKSVPEGEVSLAKFYYEKALQAFKVNNYEDALHYFARAYTMAPESEYGELSYLYYGKTYAIISYRLGSKGGILAAVGFLNQYTFVYKEPRFLELQREFLGDVYLLAGWHQDAQNVYATLYGASEKPRYLLKYAYASALLGDYDGYRRLKGLRSLPEELRYLYHLTLGIYHYDFGKYGEALKEFERAQELNPLVRYTVYFNFYTGSAFYKTNRKRRALLYLERAREQDRLGFYRTLLTYYLLNIHLELNNISEAQPYLREVKKELFYNPLYQVAYSDLWLYGDALERLGEAEHYPQIILQIGWLTFGTLLSNFPLMGMYNEVLKNRLLPPDYREYISLSSFRPREFVLEKELFTYDRQIKELRKRLNSLTPLYERDSRLIRDLYYANKENFLRIFGDRRSLYTLARALIYFGDREALRILSEIPPSPERNYLLGKLYILFGDREAGLRLIREALYGLEDYDSLEAYLLLFLTQRSENITDVLFLTEEDERFRAFFPELYKAAGDILYRKGRCREAISLYRKFTDSYEKKDPALGIVLFRMAVCAEKLGDEKTLEFVRNKASELENLWSNTILTLWGGG